MEPQNLCCVITHEMYRDPVILTGSGNTYDRAAILAHLHNSDMDPITNAPLGATEIITNWDKRREVQAFLDANQGFVPEGWASHEMPPPRPQSPRPDSANDHRRNTRPGRPNEYRLDMSLNLEGKHLAVIVAAFFAWRYFQRERN